MNKIYTTIFDAKIWYIELIIYSSAQSIIVENQKIITDSFNINIISKELDNERYWIRTSNTWSLCFQKKNNKNEKIKITCKIISLKWIDSTPDSGQYLDAISFYNKQYNVCLWTEDIDLLKLRTEAREDILSDVMKRLDTFNTYHEDGFELLLPDINNNEKIKFHYIIACNYFEEDDISPWNAVDQNINS